jgi:hypothetical protein
MAYERWFSDWTPDLLDTYTATCNLHTCSLYSAIFYFTVTVYSSLKHALSPLGLLSL